MTSTNRGLNRFFIFLVGLILLVLGLAAIAVAAVPVITTGWQDTAPTVQQNVDGVHAAAAINPQVSWVTIGVIAVLVILAVLLIVFIFKQGHGRTSRLLRDDSTEHGVTVVDAKVAESLLQEALDDREELVASHVTTFDVKGTPTLNVSVTARRGVSPKDVAITVNTAVKALDGVLGREIPTYLHISGGFRARTASATRLQ